MPRIVSEHGPVLLPARFAHLVDELAGELKSASESGEPVIHEDRFPRSDRIRSTVIWNKWEGVPYEDRVEIIRSAYARVESQEFNERMTLFVALTFPEACEAGMLPYGIIPLVRKTDPISADDCLRAMKAEGVNRFLPDGKPELRFVTKEEARKAVQRLIERLPGSDEVWTITWRPDQTDEVEWLPG